MHRTNLLIAALLLVLATFASRTAFADGKDEAVTDPAKADADFKIQGEYLGEVGEGDNKIKIGAQVVALGDGKFDCVVFHGGLPGEGASSETGAKSSPAR